MKTIPKKRLSTGLCRCAGCGEPRRRRLALLCKVCWWALPSHLREQWHRARGKRRRRAVARAIYETAKRLATPRKPR